MKRCPRSAERSPTATGIDLAVSEPAQELSATPYLIGNPLDASSRLAPLLGLTQAEVLSELSERTGFVYPHARYPPGERPRCSP